jgi:hypothetical protein
MYLGLIAELNFFNLRLSLKPKSSLVLSRDAPGTKKARGEEFRPTELPPPSPPLFFLTLRAMFILC